MTAQGHSANKLQSKYLKSGSLTPEATLLTILALLSGLFPQTTTLRK